MTSVLTNVMTACNDSHMETTTVAITAAQAKMLTRIADNGDTPGLVPFEQVRADDRNRDRETWTLPTKFALCDKGLVKMNSQGSLYLTREGYRAIGREEEF